MRPEPEAWPEDLIFSLFRFRDSRVGFREGEVRILFAP